MFLLYTCVRTIANSHYSILLLSLERLSLKCCGIGDSFLLLLCPPLLENKTLHSLDLSCNSIGDEGALHLATTLRLNRTLLSISLANNRVGDEGARAIAKVNSAHHLTELSTHLSSRHVPVLSISFFATLHTFSILLLQYELLWPLRY